MFSREEVKLFKGIAIVMMIFLHLFNNKLYLSKGDMYFTLTKFANLCVPIYVFLSGYGLSKSSQLSFRDSLFRIRKFYYLYWPVFFISIAFLYIKQIQNFNSCEFFLNLIGLSYSYNHIWWFIPMYFCLLLSFPILYKLREKYYVVIVACLMIKVVGKICLDRYTHESPGCFPEIIFAILNSYCSFLVTFFMGILLSSNSNYSKYIEYLKSRILVSLLILLGGIGITCNLPYIGILSFVLVPLLLPTLTVFMSQCFVRLGDLSSSIWLFHGIFLICYGDYFYKLREPILIFIVFLLFNVLCAILYSMIVGIVKKYIYFNL